MATKKKVFKVLAPITLKKSGKMLIPGDDVSEDELTMPLEEAVKLRLVKGDKAIDAKSKPGIVAEALEKEKK